MIDWKEAARHYRHQMILADQQEARLKRRLWAQREALQQIAWMADAEEPLSVKAGQIAREALEEV